MFLIETDAPFAPGMCLVTKKGPGGPFVDLDRDFDEDHVGRMYVHVSAVRDMWNIVKHLYEEPVHDDRDARIEQLELELAEKRRQLDAVYVLKQGPFTAGKKPGRKPKTKEPAGAS